jgi:hypothetical protein
MAKKKEKEVDYGALNSPLMRIPKIDIATVRDLLDLGFTYPDELAGRSPDALFADLRRLRPQAPEARLWYFRMAVYFAETPEPEREKMSPWAWKD